MTSEIGDLVFRIGVFIVANGLEEEIEKHILKKEDALSARINNGNFRDNKSSQIHISKDQQYDLYKTSTRSDAKHPQEDKYESSLQSPLKENVTIYNGIKVGFPVMMYLYGAKFFRTSKVESVHIDSGDIHFKTLNSTYKLVKK